MHNKRALLSFMPSSSLFATTRMRSTTGAKMLYLQYWFLILLTLAFCGAPRHFDASDIPNIPKPSNNRHPPPNVPPLVYLYAEARDILRQISQLDCKIDILRGFLIGYDPSIMLNTMEMLIGGGPAPEAEPLASSLERGSKEKQIVFNQAHKELLTARQLHYQIVQETIATWYNIPKPDRLEIFDLILLLSYKDQAANALLQMALGPLASSLARINCPLLKFYSYVNSWEEGIKMFFHELYNLNVLHNKLRHTRTLLEFILSDGAPPGGPQIELILCNLARLRPLAADRLLGKPLEKIAQALKPLLPQGPYQNNYEYLYNIIVGLRRKLLLAMVSFHITFPKITRQFNLSLSSWPSMTNFLGMLQAVSPAARNILWAHATFVQQSNLPNLLDIDISLYLSPQLHSLLYKFAMVRRFTNPIHADDKVTINPLWLHR